MRRSRQIITVAGIALIFTSSMVAADTGDVENSHDYTGFPRPPGYVITDYDEDNPSTFDFPVSRPLPIDSANIEMVHATGHRYVIQYELGAGGIAKSLLQTQRYYENLAAVGGYIEEKTGAVGDVSETFVQQQGNRYIWVYLVPSGNALSLTVMEASEAPPPQAAPPPPPAPPAPVIAQTPPPAPAPPPVVGPQPPAPTPAPAAPPPPPPVATEPAPAPEIADEGEDPLYTTLMRDGHVVLPITFLPGKLDIESESKPVIQRVIAMLKLHPDLQIEIDGHTDNYGGPEENRYISTQRALTVKGMLTAGHISRRRLTAVGKGGSQPIADNDTADGREKNRRIELVLRKNGAKKETSGEDSADSESSSKNDSDFHPTAPNGQNYYPSSASSASEADSSR